MPKKSYDIALIDIKLPDISGTEVVREIAKISPSTEFIYMTAHAMLDTAIKAVKQEHVISYETKPLDMNHLLSIIKQITERKRAEDELKKYHGNLEELVRKRTDELMKINNIRNI